MRELKPFEASVIAGGVDYVLIGEVDNDSPFIGGFVDGANFVIYSFGFSLGIIATPVVMAYRATITIASHLTDGAYTLGNLIHNATSYTYHAIAG